MRAPLFAAMLIACGGEDTAEDTAFDTDTDAENSGEDTDLDTDTDEDPDPEPDGPWVGEVTTTDHGDGTWSTVVDATDPEGWTYFDFSAPEAVADAASGAWDLAFRRDAVAVNGGSSGDGGVGVHRLDQVPFEAITFPGSGPLAVDAPDADGDGADEHAFAGWYDYDSVTHKLSPADRTWLVTDRSGEVWRLRFDGYYDDHGVSGHPSFTWAPVTATSPLTVTVEPDGTRSATVEATDADAPVYLRLGLDLALTPVDPTTSDAWDLALARTVLTVGGGSSGAGQTEVAVLPGQDFAALTEAPTSGYVTDADTNGDGETDSYAFADWYVYDDLTHAVTPKDQVWVLRTTDGRAFKLQLQAYASGVHTLRYAEVTP